MGAGLIGKERRIHNESMAEFLKELARTEFAGHQTKDLSWVARSGNHCVQQGDYRRAAPLRQMRTLNWHKEKRLAGAMTSAI
jgi:hypothetical protein